MPLFYFDVCNDDVAIDDEGADLADEASAHAHAIKAVRSLAAHTVGMGHFTRHHRIEITDAEREPVRRVRFDEAVQIRD